MSAGRTGDPASSRPPRAVVRGDTTWGLQSALHRRGLGPVAGVDEAGRGACAGPLVVAACVLRHGDGARLAELTDSKLLTEAARERVYQRVLARAVDYVVITVAPDEVDAFGVHVTNVEGMRRAVACLAVAPGYVLTDGFRVAGLSVPSVPVPKGDQAVACVSAASVLAKVTRDRIMNGLHGEHPVYGFDAHKGYSTPEHRQALTTHGPSEAHRWSYANVAAAAAAHGQRAPRRVALSAAARAEVGASVRAESSDVGQNGFFADEYRLNSRGGAQIP